MKNLISKITKGLGIMERILTLLIILSTTLHADWETSSFDHPFDRSKIGQMDSTNLAGETFGIACTTMLVILRLHTNEDYQEGGYAMQFGKFGSTHFTIDGTEGFDLPSTGQLRDDDTYISVITLDRTIPIPAGGESVIDLMMAGDEIQISTPGSTTKFMFDITKFEENFTSTCNQ